MINIEFPKKILKALSKLCAKDDIRTFLNGVKIEMKKEHINFVATDGFILGIYHHKSDKINNKEDEFIIPIEIINKISKESSKNKKIGLTEFITIKELDNTNVRGRKFELSDIDNGIIFFELIFGKYPDYKKCIPTEIKEKIAHFDPKLLIKFHEAIEILTGIKKNNYILTQLGDKGIITPELNNTPFMGVIMGLRKEKKYNILPDWVKEL